MPTAIFPRALIYQLATGLAVVTTICWSSPSQARGWQQWVQTGVNYARQGASIVRSSNGGYDSAPSSGAQESVHAQPYSPPPQQPSSSAGTYYNVAPSTMEIPHSQPPAQSLPATPYTPSSQAHRAYHSGQDASIPDASPGLRYAIQQTRLRHTKHQVDHVVSHKDTPQLAQPSSPPIETIKTETLLNGFKTDWIPSEMDTILQKMEPKMKG